MLSLVYTFRLLGPTLGYMLGGFCLKTYVYPSQEVPFDEKDIQWIGAWWLGFPIIGCLIAAFAGKELPKARRIRLVVNFITWMPCFWTFFSSLLI